jgi:hypothetical protein
MSRLLIYKEKKSNNKISGFYFILYDYRQRESGTTLKHRIKAYE